MRLSVIIPQYKHYDLLHQILFDLYKHCRSDIDEVVIVDDASEDRDLDNYLSLGMGIKFFNTKVFTNSENLGFLKTVNRGVSKSTGDIVVVLSNDVRVYKNICTEIKAILQEHDKHLIGGRLLNYDTGWNLFGDKLFQYLEGWLLACTKDAWNEFGGFDEQYGSSDYEDIDISTTALSLGYSLVELSDGVRHDHPASSYGYNPEREARTKENREKFRKKWIG